MIALRGRRARRAARVRIVFQTLRTWQPMPVIEEANIPQASVDCLYQLSGALHTQVNHYVDRVVAAIGDSTRQQFAFDRLEQGHDFAEVRLDTKPERLGQIIGATVYVSHGRNSFSV